MLLCSFFKQKHAPALRIGAHFGMQIPEVIVEFSVLNNPDFD